MAVTPKEVLEKLDAAEEFRVKAMEETIDAELRRLYRGGPMLMYVEHSGNSPRVKERLKSMYRAAGWVIEFGSNQRDGEFITFDAAPAISDPRPDKEGVQLKGGGS